MLDTFAPRGLENVDSGCRVEGKVVVEPGARLVRSTVRGPAIIGAGAEIRDAFVDPYTAIGPDCFVERCEIENSIVLENSTIANVDGRIEASLIGKNVKITRTHRKPAAYRFMLGDNSEVGIT